MRIRDPRGLSPASAREGGGFQCRLRGRVVEPAMSLSAGATYCADPAVPKRLGPALPSSPTRRGLLAPLPRGGSAPRGATRALVPGRGHPRALSNSLRLSLGARTKPSWFLDPVSSKGGTAHSTWQLLGRRCVFHAATVTVSPRDSWGPAPASAVTTPFLPDHTRCSGPCWEPPLFSHPWDQN